MALFNLFSKPKVSPFVFFHIPKTGGSTFIASVKEGIGVKDDVPTHLTKIVGDLQVFHVDFNSSERKFEGRDILKKIEDYPKSKFFILFRDPAKRLLSEFNFQFHILNGKLGNPSAAILKKIGKIPSGFSEYIKFREVQDYQTKFLLGRKLADPSPIENDGFDSIKAIINRENVFVGTTEKFNSFLNLFVEETGIELPQKLMVRKKAPISLNTKISKDDLNYVTSNNQKDFTLYKLASERASHYEVKNNKKYYFDLPKKFTP